MTAQLLLPPVAIAVIPVSATPALRNTRTARERPGGIEELFTVPSNVVPSPSCPN